MQEVSLFSGISVDKREKVVRLLEQLTGRKPHEFKEWHLVYAPPASSDSDSTFLARPDLYLRLSASLTNNCNVNNHINNDFISTSNNTSNTLTQFFSYDWKISLVDVPDMGIKRPVTSRLYLQSHVLSGNVFTFLQELDYVFHFEYVMQGVQFIYGNCILILFQTLRPLEKHLLEDLVQVDVSGGWILQASVYVEDASDQTLMTQATDKLAQIRKILNGICHLEPVTDNRLR